MVGDGRLQRRERRTRDRTGRHQQRHPQAGVGLGRSADVGLVRDEIRRPRRQRRARPGHARPERSLGRGAGRSCRRRRGGRARARRSRAQVAAPGLPRRGARRAALVARRSRRARQRRPPRAAARPRGLRYDGAPQRRHAPARGGHPGGADRPERAGDDLHGWWLGAGPRPPPGQRRRGTHLAPRRRRDRRRRSGGSVATAEAAARPCHRPCHRRRRACGSVSTTRREQLIRDDVAAEGYTDVHLDDNARRPVPGTALRDRACGCAAARRARSRRLDVPGRRLHRLGRTADGHPGPGRGDPAAAGLGGRCRPRRAHRGRRRGRPVRLPARAQHARPGRRADTAHRRRGHRGRGRRRGGRRRVGGRGRADRGAGDRGGRQVHARPPGATGRARVCGRGGGTRGPSSW